MSRLGLGFEVAGLCTSKGVDSNLGFQAWFGLYGYENALQIPAANRLKASY